MWHPYQSKSQNSSPLANNNSSSNANLYQPPASNSPLDTQSANSSTSSNSSPNDKLNIQTPLSIASLIPTPSYDDDDEQQNQHESISPSLNTHQFQQNFSAHQHLINHQLPVQHLAHQNQYGRSSIGGSSDGSSASDISATSTPTYRSPPSSFSYANTQNYYNQPVQAYPAHGYQYFSGIDFNNAYYQQSMQNNRYLNPAMPIKSEMDELKVTPPPQPQITTSPTSFMPPVANTMHPHANHYAAYYNNMSLNQVGNPYAHYNHHHQQQLSSYNNPAPQINTSSSSPSPSHAENLNNSNTSQKNVKQSPVLAPQQPNKDYMYDSNPIYLPNFNTVKTNPNIKVKLQDMNLWKQFNSIGTEMIITKCGRRMFPSLRLSVSGLESSSKYIMVIDIIPADDNRYKYHNCEWIVSGKCEEHIGGRGYLHPDSPLSGSQWMKQVISFHKLKLTNNPFDKTGHIVLNSMHRYIPRLHIIEENNKTLNTFIFPEGMFTAVTAYQNEAITKLKIEYNPFAKGFRDGQNRKDYRAKRSSDDENEAQDENSSSSMFSQMNKFAKGQHQQQQAQSVLGNKDMNAKYMASNCQQQGFHPLQPSYQANMSSFKYDNSENSSNSKLNEHGESGAGPILYEY